MADGDSYQSKTVGAAAVAFVLPAGTRRVRIINVNGADEVYLSTNGTTPTVAGNFRVLPASVGASRTCDVEAGASQTTPARVLLIAASNTECAVEVVA